jgi:hypothetical protein
VPNEITAPEAISMLVGFDTAAFAFETPPTFDSVEDERSYREQELTLALQLFGKSGFGEEVAGHMTDPQNPQRFWVNPFGVNLRRIKASGLIRVDHDGNIIDGNRPMHKAALCIHYELHKPRPDALTALHAHSLHGKAFSNPHRRPDPLTQDACQFYNHHGFYNDFGGVVTNRAKARGSTRRRCTPRSSPSNRTCSTDGCPSQRDRPRQPGIAAGR